MHPLRLLDTFGKEDELLHYLGLVAVDQQRSGQLRFSVPASGTEAGVIAARHLTGT